MIPISQLPTNLTIAQKFFIERTLELVNSKTIDTYRARLHNPRTILIELHQSIIDWDKEKLKRFDTVKKIIDEAILLLGEDEELDFGSIEKIYYIELLKTAAEGNYLSLAAATKMIIRHNDDFITKLYNATKEKIDGCNGNTNLQIHDLIPLERLLGCLITELLSIGYSKTYLNNSMYSIFVKNVQQNTFDVRYNIFSQLKDRLEEEFDVIFKIIIPKEELREQLIIAEENVEYDQQAITELIDRTNDSGRKFLKISYEFSKHLLVKVKSKDYYTVIEKAKERVSEIFDRIFLGYNQPNINLYKEALVIGANNPDRAKSNPVNYRILGSYVSNQALYEVLQSKIREILENVDISDDTKQKIKSSIRYLRLGNDSTEIEQRFLNYWIGIEFIFATSVNKKSSFSRLIDNFPNSHQLIYYKRNIREFHEDIKRLRLNTELPFFEDIYHNYLNLESSYDFVKDNFFESRPIIAFRAYQLKSVLFHSERRKARLDRHRKYIEWNLSRVYRIRNEIIHEAALKPTIVRITSHIRYYLTFVIISLIEYLTDSPYDINSDKKITIDDFFTLQELYYKSNMKNGFSLDNIFAIKNPVEIFNK